jgi:uncharacterized protein YjdB
MSKRKFKGVLMASGLLVFSAVTLTGLVGCGETTVDEITALSITNKAALEASWTVGDADRTLEVALTPDTFTLADALADGKVTIESSNTSVVTVSGATLKAVAVGTSTITVKASDSVKDSVSITVSEAEAEITSLTIANKEDLTAEWHVGDADRTLAITANEGINVTEALLNDKIVVASSDETVIQTNGKKLTALKAGTATITVKIPDGSVSDTVEITVLAKVEVAVTPINTLISEFATANPTSGTYGDTEVAVAGVVVANDGSENMVVYDGTGFIVVFGTSYVSNYGDYVVGTKVKVTGTLNTYYGVVELKPEEVEHDPEGVTTEIPDPETYGVDQFTAYKTTALANNSEIQDGKATPTPYIEVTTTYQGGTEGEYYFDTPGDSKYPINIYKSKDEIKEKTSTLTSGATYIIKGALIGLNSGKGYYNLIAESITEKVYTVETIAIDNPDKTEIMINEPLQLSATITPAEASANTVTWTSSDQTVATVDATGLVRGVAAGTADITATSGGVTSAAVTITVTNEVAETNVSAETGLVNGTVSVTPSGEGIAPGVVTITPEADTGYLVDTVYVKIDGGESTLIDEVDGVYTYTTQNNHSYVFGATFKVIAVSTIAEAKAVDEGTYVRFKGVVTYLISQRTLYVQNGTDGAYLYLDVALTEDLKVGDKVDVYLKKSLYNSTIEFVNDSGDDSYISIIEDESITSTPTTIDTAAKVNGLTLSDVGNAVEFRAIVKSGSVTLNTGSTVTVTIDGVDIGIYVAKAYATQEVVDLWNSLSAGDLIKVKTVVGNYKTTLQFLWITGTTVEKVTGDTPTGIAVTASKSEATVGDEITLGYTLIPWTATTTDTVTYKIVSGSDYATLDGSTLTTTAVGTVGVVAKLGEFTSDELSIVINEEVSGETKSFTIDAYSVTETPTNMSYSDYTFNTSYEGGTLGMEGYFSFTKVIDTQCIQFRSKADPVAFLRNTSTIPGVITKLSFNYAKLNGLRIYGSTAAITDVSSLTQIYSSGSVASTNLDEFASVDVEVDGNLGYTYFYFSATSADGGNGASIFKDITIEYLV